MIERISMAIANANINILDLLNKSRGELACTLVDTASLVPESVVNAIAQTEGVLAVRVL
jgi:D-3-phosphoglycerate dehydrogenase